MAALSRSWPLVSCVMPTRNRPRLAAQAHYLFERQSYPNTELIIVADGTSLSGVIPQNDYVRLVELPDRRTIGEKRNIGCAFAHGDIIAQWDDDDWYGPRRLEAQARPIVEGQADVTGLTCAALLNVRTMECWTCTTAEHWRLFGRVASGTLVYSAQVWYELARYPRQSLAEDAVFLLEARRRGARLQALTGSGHFVYVRHDSNSWQMKVDRSAWHSVRNPLRHRDRAFYATLNANPNSVNKRFVKASATRHLRRKAPLVSCIMPTANRPHLVRLALEYFHRQDYRECEIIVVDDGESSVANLVGEAVNVRYLRIARGLSLGQKRNLACEAARGAVICHWDDDDWYSSTRLSFQVRELVGSTRQICGLTEPMFFDTRTRRGWQYGSTPGVQAWLAGATLCYWRDAWLRNPFGDLHCGEDNGFVSRFAPGEILRHSDRSFFMGMIHESNSSPKRIGAPSWTEVKLDQIRRILGDDFDNYCSRTAWDTEDPGACHRSPTR